MPRKHHGSKPLSPECPECKKILAHWNEHCHGCGYKLALEPQEAARARYLRGPSLGALFFTQGWAFGARLYLWFLLSLIPIVGLAILPLLVLFGRRLAWTMESWESWDDFTSRMRLMDIIGVIWLTGLIIVYFWLRSISGA